MASNTDTTTDELPDSFHELAAQDGDTPTPITFACPYCPDADRYTDTEQRNVKSHITNTDDTYHEGKRGNDPQTTILVRDADGNHLDIGEVQPQKDDANANGTIETTIGDVSYTGPAEGIDLTDEPGEQHISERPHDDTDDTDDAQENYNRTDDAVPLDNPVSPRIAKLSDDELPSTGHARDHRRLLALIDQHDNPTTTAMLDRVNRSKSWVEQRLNGLYDHGHVTRDRDHGKQPYTYDLALDDDTESADDTDGLDALDGETAAVLTDAALRSAAKASDRVEAVEDEIAHYEQLADEVDSPELAAHAEGMRRTLAVLGFAQD